MFESVKDVELRLREQGYICGKNIATVVFLATRLEKPVLVEGPAGVGKTELAKVVAAATGRNLIRLQCYEGLDEAKALYEWEYSKQLLYTQILKDKFAEAISGATSLRDAAARVAQEDSVFFSDRFIVPRPLLRAIQAEELTLLLIDEVDKSDPEFEAFLLEVLSDFQVTVPEIGTLVARNLPFVFLTAIVLIFTVLTRGKFLKPRNLVNVLRFSAVFIIMGVGMTFVIIAAGIDLSVGSVFAFASVIVSGTMPKCWYANHRPVRAGAVHTSSQISRISRSSHSARRPRMYSGLGTFTPPSPWIGSTMSAAVSSSTACWTPARSP